jgi:hypothetical protein
MDRGIEDSDAFSNAFLFEPEHLLFNWGILLVFIVVGIILTGLMLKRRDNR